MIRKIDQQKYKTSNFYVVIWFISYIYLIRGEPYWIVNAKVSGYGENLTLFCLVNDCCNEAAGWIKFDPDYKTIYLDVRDSTNYTSKDKYAANSNSSGFSLVIKNIQKEDINIGYSCVYGFDKSRKRVLLQSDAFRDDEIIFPVAEIIGSIIVIVILFVLAVIFLYFWISKRTKRPLSQTDDGADCDLLKENENRINLVNGTSTPTALSQTDDGADCDLLKENENRINLVNGTSTPTADIVIIHTDNKQTARKGVMWFQWRLQQLSKGNEHRRISIKLFEEAFPGGAKIQHVKTVLEKCKYVFVYISPKTCKSDRFGQNELLIKNAIENQKENNYIKIVINCGKWYLEKLSVDPKSVFLDYYGYDTHDDMMKKQFNKNFEQIVETCI